MLTETHILDDRGPKTVLWWDGVPMMYAIRYSEGTVDISDISENDDLYPVGARREKSQEMLDALVEWLILHDFDDMAGEWSEGEPQIRCTTNEHARVRFNARGGTIRWLKETAANIRIWDGKTIELLPAKPSSAPAPTVKGERPPLQAFHIPSYQGKRYPAFQTFTKVEKDGVTIGFGDAALIITGPKATQVFGDQRKSMGTRVQHLAAALNLDFRVLHKGGMWCVIPNDGYVASNSEGDLALEGEAIPLGLPIIVEAA